MRFFGKSGKTRSIVCSLPSLACLFALLFAAQAHAQTPLPLRNPAPSRPVAAAPRVDLNSGQALAHRAVAMVEEQASIRANLRYKVDLIGHQLSGSGIYLQQGRGAQRMFRMEMKTQTTPQVSTLLQVCDGNNLWTHQALGTLTTLTRVDMVRLGRARPKSEQTISAPSLTLELGGLPKLFTSVDAAFEFAQPTESRLDDVRMLKLVGRWRAARLAAYLPDQKDAILAGKEANTEKLPANMPDAVVLFVGYDDKFPYRIEYWRSAPVSDEAGQGGSSGLGRMTAVMELYGVQLGAPIDRAQFAYKPAGLVPVDRTQAVLEKLGLEDGAPLGASQRLPPRR